MSKRRLALLALAALVPVVGSADAAGPGHAPGASAQAIAVRIVVPGRDGAATSTVVAPPRDSTSFLSGFQYPGDGSIVSTGAITVSARTTSGATATAAAAADVTAVSLFKGEITADGIGGHANASAGAGAAVGNFNGAATANLVALGQPIQVAANARVPLGDWGYAIVLAQGVDPSAPQGATGYRGFVTGLDVHLNSDHGGLPAGSEIQIGFAQAAVQTAPPAIFGGTTGTGAGAPSLGLEGGDRPQTRSESRRRATPGNPILHRAPPTVTPRLTAGGYVFPVYGASSYIDTFGAARADVSYHHGDDIFGQLGQPLLAVAGGTVFSVGWNKVGGNRLWLRDHQGNQFYYAHLSAFSTLAHNGAHVQAGAVVGFMGATGDAQGTPVHLHFEVHPVSLLFLGYDGAVDPSTYLEAWQRLKDVSFPLGLGWAPLPHGSKPPPEPGAILLQASDISQADGLEPGSLQRAFLAPVSFGNDTLFGPTQAPPGTAPALPRG